MILFKQIRRIILTLTMLLSIVFVSYAQGNRVNFFYGKSLSQVYTAKEVVFFGYDMNHFRITLPEDQMYENQICRKISDVPGWILTKFPPSKTQKFLGLKNMTVDLKSIQSPNDFKNFDCTINEPYLLEKTQIAEIIKGYSLPTSTAGKVGFVCIPEYLRKARGYAAVYFVFFDCDTRKVLYAGHTYHSDKGGNTVRAYYGEAVWWAFREFADHVTEKLNTESR